jgi:pimeloyl-ACP methyl ester carboxylesterase
MLHLGRPCAILVALALMGCAASPSASTPASPSATSTSVATAGPTSPSPVAATPPAGRSLAGEPLTPCSVGGFRALCGSLAVPEDRSIPAGRAISLRVVVVPAHQAVPAPDPVFGLAGGPGGAASDGLAWMPGVFAGIHAVRDIVLVDQRGTGGSNQLALPAFPDTSGLDDAASSLAWSDWEANLLSGLNADPTQYTSAVAADDLDAVRAALGYDRIDLYGPSYGATLAQYYLRQHGDHVRVAVLDGGTPLDVPLFELRAASSQHALDLVLDRCAADPACAAAYPNVRDDLARLLAHLAKPRTTGLVDPATGQPVVLTRADVTSLIHASLLTAAQAANLPAGIHMAAADQWQAIQDVFGSGATFASTSLLMTEEIQCSEAWAAYDPAAVARLGSASYLLDAEVAQATFVQTMCAHLPKGVAPPADAAPARTDVPVLWTVGEADPQDPPANLEAVPDQMPNSRVVSVPGQGHTVSHLGCLPAIVTAFIQAGTTTGLDTSCVAGGGVPIPPFALP